MTKEEEADVLEMRLEWKKSKRIQELQEQATTERRAIQNQQVTLQKSLSDAYAPIQTKLQADIIAVQSAKTVEEIP